MFPVVHDFVDKNSCGQLVKVTLVVDGLIQLICIRFHELVDLTGQQGLGSEQMSFRSLRQFCDMIKKIFLLHL